MTKSSYCEHNAHVFCTSTCKCMCHGIVLSPEYTTLLYEFLMTQSLPQDNEELINVITYIGLAAKVYHKDKIFK